MEKRKIGMAAIAVTASLWTLLASGCASFLGNPHASDGGVAGKSPSAASPVPTPTPDPIKEQIKGMTLDEKIGQLVMVGLDGTTAGETALGMVTKYRVGGFILYKNNITGVQQTTSLLNALKKANAGDKASVPLFLSVDQEGGKVDRLLDLFAPLPTNRAIGAVGKPEFSAEIGKRIGEELAMLGFNMDFAPVLDIDSNPNNPVIGDRSFGPTASLVSKLGIATMNGIRSKGVVPVVKHFPGHGDTSVDSHRALPLVEKSREQLGKLELVPFEDAIGQQADVVMIAHILLPKLDDKYPSSFSKAVITDLLRGELHYDGVVITDDMTMGAVLQNFPIEEAALRAVQAGADIVLVAHDAEKETSVIQTLKQSAEDGTLPMARIDESVYRILKLKQTYRLADQPAAKQDVKAVTANIRETLKTYMPQSGS